MNGMVKQVYDLGVPLNLHANGDGGDRRVPHGPRVRARPTTSARTAERDDDSLPVHPHATRSRSSSRYKIRPSFYTLHTYYFAEAHIANRGAGAGGITDSRH